MANIKPTMEQYRKNPNWQEDSIPNGDSFQNFINGIEINQRNVKAYPRIFNDNGEIIERIPEKEPFKDAIENSIQQHDSFLNSEFDLKTSIDEYKKFDQETLHYKIGSLKERAETLLPEARPYDKPVDEIYDLSFAYKNPGRLLGDKLARRYFMKYKNFYCDFSKDDYIWIFPQKATGGTLSITYNPSIQKYHVMYEVYCEIRHVIGGARIGWMPYFLKSEYRELMKVVAQEGVIGGKARFAYLNRDGSFELINTLFDINTYIRLECDASITCDNSSTSINESLLINTEKSWSK